MYLRTSRNNESENIDTSMNESRIPIKLKKPYNVVFLNTVYSIRFTYNPHQYQCKSVDSYSLEEKIEYSVSRTLFIGNLVQEMTSNESLPVYGLTKMPKNGKSSRKF